LITDILESAHSPYPGMLGLLNPFDDLAFGRPPLARTIRATPPTRPRTEPSALQPRINLEDQPHAYTATVLPPIHGVHLRGAHAEITGRSELQVSGQIVFIDDQHHTYQVRRPAAVYAEPSPHAIIGRVPAGSIIKGGAPSSRGWIALDDDEAWMLADGRLVLIDRPRAPSNFARRVDLPNDADLNRASADELPDGGLRITVPRKVRAMRPMYKRPCGSPPTSPLPHSPVPATWQAHESMQPRDFDTVGKTAKKAAVAPSPKPAQAPKGATDATIVSQSAASISDRKTDTAVKRSRSLNNDKQTLKASIHDELRKLSNNEPVLVATTATADNVSLPKELIEQWVAVQGGGFKLDK